MLFDSAKTFGLAVLIHYRHINLRPQYARPHLSLFIRSLKTHTLQQLAFACTPITTEIDSLAPRHHHNWPNL